MLFELTLFQTLTICFAAFIIGMSKTGIQGITALAIPYMALAFGAKESTGVMLPLLCMADIIGVAYYRKTADLKVVMKLLPAAVLGFFLAIYVDTLIPVSGFKTLLGATLLLVFAILLWSEYCGKEMSFGIKVSHSHRRSNRTWKPNIKRVKAIVNGSPCRVYACTRCLRSGKVTRAV